MPTDVHRRALQRALEISGGIDPLAAYLKVPATAVRFWANGSSPLPGDMFLKIVDLLLDRSMMELQPPLPRKPAAPVPGSGRNASDS